MSQPLNRSSFDDVGLSVKVSVDRTSFLQRSTESEVAPWADLEDDISVVPNTPAHNETNTKESTGVTKAYTRFFSTICSCIPVTLPSNPWIEKWDVVMCFLLLYVAVVAPYDMAFLPARLDAIFYFNRVVDLGFIIDMFVQFNLAYYGAFGRIQKNKDCIVQHYVEGWFLLDLISIIPFDTFSLMADNSDLSNMQGLKALRLFRLAKMLRLLRANRMFARFEARMALTYSLLLLYGFIIMIILIIHWLACAWYMVVNLESNTECHQPGWSIKECCLNWFDCYPGSDWMEGDTAGRKYFLAVTWSAAEVLTVSSDIFPVTDAERGYQILVRIVSGVVYAYLIGAVCSIFTTLTKDQQAFFEDMDRLNGFLRSVEINTGDPRLCMNLRLFYRYSHKLSSGSSHIKDIFHVISPNLRGQLAYRVHSTWLEAVTLFKGARFSAQFYVSLALELEQKIFAPEENIIEPHHRADSILIIERGLVFADGKVKTVGDCIGEDCMYNHRKDPRRGYMAMGVTHGKLIVIQAKVLTEILGRPQFRVEGQHVRKRIMWNTLREVMVHFYRVMVDGAKAVTIMQGHSRVCVALSFVPEQAMDEILRIFTRFYVRSHPYADTDVERSMKEAELAKTRTLSDTRKKCVADIETIRQILEPLGLTRETARVLVEVQKLDVAKLMAVTPSDLYRMNIPMGTALKFCHTIRPGLQFSSSGEYKGCVSRAGSRVVSTVDIANIAAQIPNANGISYEDIRLNPSEKHYGQSTGASKPSSGASSLKGSPRAPADQEKDLVLRKRTSNFQTRFAPRRWSTDDHEDETTPRRSDLGGGDLMDGDSPSTPVCI